MILKLIQKLPVFWQKSIGVIIVVIAAIFILSGWLSWQWALAVFVIQALLVVAWWHYVIGAMYPSRRTRGKDGRFISKS